MQKRVAVGDDQNAISQRSKQSPVMRIMAAIGIDLTLEGDIDMAQRLRSGFFQINEDFQIRIVRMPGRIVGDQFLGFDQRVDRQKDTLSSAHQPITM